VCAACETCDALGGTTEARGHDGGRAELHVVRRGEKGEANEGDTLAAGEDLVPWN